jgi:hypothetical protein
MTRDQASAVLSRLRVRAIESNAHGILIQRAGVVCEQPFADGPTPLRRDRRGYYNCEQWRVESGGGIAVSRCVWLRHMHTDKRRIGPYATVREFESAIRAWRRWDLP